jgi:hypothetical protein
LKISNENNEMRIHVQVNFPASVFVNFHSF